jgi:hypothetical protein
MVVSPLARTREEGYLVLADITGYTSFLTRTELEHAHGIVAELTTLVIARLAAPLRFVELEGDAVFAYAPSGCDWRRCGSPPRAPARPARSWAASI